MPDGDVFTIVDLTSHRRAIQSARALRPSSAESGVTAARDADRCRMGGARCKLAESMKISVFAGDLCDVHADALCTSTNPRLSLAMGSGASIRGRGGDRILRACEEIVNAEFRRSGQHGLPAGSVHATTAGNLPSKLIAHCIASDAAHHSSADIIRSCVKNALALADRSGCTSIAMPLLGTGHARFNFDQAVLAMAETLRDAATAVQHVFIVVYDPERADDVVRLIHSVIPAAEVDVQRGPDTNDEAAGMWSAGWDALS